jgi:hypothetical protein
MTYWRIARNIVMTKPIKGQTLTDLETITPLSIATTVDTGTCWTDMATLLAAGGTLQVASAPCRTRNRTPCSKVIGTGFARQPVQ